MSALTSNNLGRCLILFLNFLQCCIIEACRDGIWWYNKVVNDVTYNLKISPTYVKLNGSFLVLVVCMSSLLNGFLMLKYLSVLAIS